jgi:recombination protein RecA
MWGDNRTTPGGKAKNFHYFCRVEVKRDEWLKEKDETVGQTIKGRTIKNKTHRPQQSAVIDFYFADSEHFSFGSFDVVKDMVNIGIASGLIERAGAFYSYDGQKWQGKDKVLDGVREDLGLQAKLRGEVFAKYGIES